MAQNKGYKMYYKAKITLSTENLWLNKKTGQYEGCDPDTFQDNGIILEYKGTLEEIKNKLKREIAKIESWEYDEINNCLNWSCEGEYDYRMPKEDRIPFIENYSLYLVKVEETEMNPELLKKVEA